MWSDFLALFERGLARLGDLVLVGAAASHAPVARGLLLALYDDAAEGVVRRATSASGLGGGDPYRVADVWRGAWARFVEGEGERATGAPATTLEEAMETAIDDDDERAAAIATFKARELEWSHYDDLYLVSGLLANEAPFRVDLDDPESDEVARAMLELPLVVEGGDRAASSFVAALSKRAKALHKIGATSAKLRRLAPSLRAHLDGALRAPDAPVAT